MEKREMDRIIDKIICQLDAIPKQNAKIEFYLSHAIQTLEKIEDIS